MQRSMTYWELAWMVLNFWGKVFFLLAVCSPPCHSNSWLHDHFGFYAIYWLQGVSFPPFPCAELVIQTGTWAQVPHTFLFSPWIRGWILAMGNPADCRRAAPWARNERPATQRRTGLSPQTGLVKPVATGQCDGINEGTRQPALTSWDKFTERQCHIQLLCFVVVPWGWGRSDNLRESKQEILGVEKASMSKAHADLL